MGRVAKAIENEVTVSIQEPALCGAALWGGASTVPRAPDLKESWSSICAALDKG